MYILVGVAFIICLAIVGFAYFTTKGSSASDSYSGKQKKAEEVKRSSIKDFFKIDNIERGIIQQGNIYTLVASISSTDYFLLNEEEQNQIEDIVAQALVQLQYPIQVITLSRSLDTQKMVQELINTEHTTEQIRQLAMSRADFLEALSKERDFGVNTSYICISHYTDKGLDIAEHELNFKFSILQNILMGAKQKVEQLDTAQVLDLLKNILDRHSYFNSYDAEKNAVVTDFHVSKRQVG